MHYRDYSDKLARISMQHGETFYIPFPEIWFTDTLALPVCNLQILDQFKGNNSCINDAILTKVDENDHIVMIQI